MKLSHLDEKNHPKMVDVSDKNITLRIATASGIIYMSQEAFDVIKNNTAKKGPVLQTAIIAAIMGPKKQVELFLFVNLLLLLRLKTEIVDFLKNCSFSLF